MYFYSFTCRYYDDKERAATGITFGKTYRGALSNIAETFGEDNIIEVNMKALGVENDNCLLLTTNLVKNIENYDWYDDPENAL